MIEPILWYGIAYTLLTILIFAIGTRLRFNINVLLILFILLSIIFAFIGLYLKLIAPVIISILIIAVASIITIIIRKIVLGKSDLE
jgi:hypothetical protein